MKSFINLKVKAFIIIIIFTASFQVFGLEVDVDEVTTSKKIIFNNYKGKYRRQDSARTIKRIGEKLAGGVSRIGSNRIYRFSVKYSMIHAVSKKEPEKFSADIFSIDRRARVGHVNAIRLILAGYLERMYSYSGRNAHTLSLFITYYNAIYRKNMPYFQSKYKRVVLQHINKNNAGLSTEYREWPGQTKILIPLTDKAKRGRLDSIDPDIISDKSTRDQIRKDKKFIKERKDLVDIKKKIIKKEKEKLKKDKEKLTEEKERLKDKRKKIDQKKKRLEEDKKKITEEKKKIPSIKDAKERKKKEKDIKEREEDLKKRERRIKREDKKIITKEKETEKREKDLKDQEKKITKKEKDLEKEKKEIQKDELKGESKKDSGRSGDKLKEKSKELERKERELEKREKALKEKSSSRNVFGNNLFYLKTSEWLKNGHYDNELYLINAPTRKIILKSPVQNIEGKKYDIFAGGVVVITRKTNDYDSMHRLTLLDRNTLQAKRYGTDNIFFRSFVEIRNNFIYAIVIVKGKYYLGKFDNKLEMVKKSSEEIHKDTFITFYADYIYANSKDRRIMVLNKENLTLIDKLKP